MHTTNLFIKELAENINSKLEKNPEMSLEDIINVIKQDENLQESNSMLDSIAIEFLNEILYFNIPKDKVLEHAENFINTTFINGMHVIL